MSDSMHTNSTWDQMNQFLEKQILPKLAKIKIDNINKYITLYSYNHIHTLNLAFIWGVRCIHNLKQILNLQVTHTAITLLDENKG